MFPDYDDPLLAESGLVIVNEDEDKRYDRFRDRVMFPIRNVKGECIGFGGRVLGDEKPKYLNSPETPVFSKGRELYGLFEARNALREHGYVLVTEGYMDVVALAQLGFPNAVATLGTACTPDHVQKLFRFTDSVVFSFDGDAAGRRAARKALDGALPYATDVRTVKFLFLPAEHDPDSYIREFGRDAFARYVSEAMPLSRFLIEAAREGCDLAPPRAGPTWRPTPGRCGCCCPTARSSASCSARSPSMVQLEQRELAGHCGASQGSAGRPLAAARAGPTPAPAARPATRTRLGIRPSMPRPARHIATIAAGAIPAAWDRRSATTTTTLLCELDGDLRATVSPGSTARLHEHGAQPWAALRVGAGGPAFRVHGARLIELDNLQPSRPRVVEDTGMPLADLQQTVLELQLRRARRGNQARPGAALAPIRTG